MGYYLVRQENQKYAIINDSIHNFHKFDLTEKQAASEWRKIKEIEAKKMVEEAMKSFQIYNIPNASLGPKNMAETMFRTRHQKTLEDALTSARDNKKDK